MRYLLVFLLVLASASLAPAQEVPVAEASSRIGQRVTIYGEVAAVVASADSTTIQFDGQSFVGFVPRRSYDRVGGSRYLASLQGKRIAITGYVVNGGSGPQIIIHLERQIAWR